MTKQECAIVTAYTEISMLRGDDLKYLYRYLSEIIGRPVFTHEIPEVCELFRDRIKADFISLCRNASDDIEPDALMNKADSVRSLTDEEAAVFEKWLNHDAVIEPELRHGRWIKIEPNGLQSRWKCSECDGIVHAVTNFCPYCGEKMNDFGADVGRNVSQSEAHNMSDQIKLEITFTSGETITYQPEQWDDYAYDGKAVIVKLRGALVGIYNFDSVFCVELKPV
jgi:hypothetical protein